MVPLYRIFWSEPTGFTGHGEYCLSYEAGVSWITYLQKTYPEMTHILEIDPAHV